MEFTTFRRVIILWKVSNWLGNHRGGVIILSFSSSKYDSMIGMGSELDFLGSLVRI